MFHFSHNALFVTGTDTGVGKTLITALLALKLRQLGLDCVAFKPFASGCERKNGALKSDDAEFLRKTLNLSESSEEICPIRLEEPLAPLIAARRAGISTHKWPQIARDAFENLRLKHEFVLVEGVGGILAPIWEDGRGVGSNFELIRDLDLSAVLVARRSLGTINHTLLTLRMPLDFVGVVFNDTALLEESDIAAQTSANYLAAATLIPVWGAVPFATDFEAETLGGLAGSLDLGAI